MDALKKGVSCLEFDQYVLQSEQRNMKEHMSTYNVEACRTI